jgi:hypothetical protein
LQNVIGQKHNVLIYLCKRDELGHLRESVHRARLTFDALYASLIILCMCCTCVIHVLANSQTNFLQSYMHGSCDQIKETILAFVQL